MDKSLGDIHSNPNHTFILRSDQTFVMWETEFEAYKTEFEDLSNDYYEPPDPPSLIYAEGGWEILKLKDDLVEVRVFGKYINYSQSTGNWYVGNSESHSVKIFQDKVFIDIDEYNRPRLKGSKYVGTYAYGKRN
ncbi:MAG TPA: hypothetical protein EYN89_13545 [Flavobacteriales bacterium]|nr:hypothetical protein [Flavobacteriales bacterium]